jgi:hypothetical protein
MSPSFGEQFPVADNSGTRGGKRVTMTNAEKRDLGHGSEKFQLVFDGQ